RHLREGADLARRIGRPWVEVGCLAELGFASKLHSLATTRRWCREAVALAERYGWGTEWIVAPALVMLAGASACTGDFDDGERWLQRTAQALQSDTGPGITLLMHQVAGMLQVGRGRVREALEEFTEAERRQTQLAGPHALANQVTGWMLAAQARLGRSGEAGAAIAALDAERANSGEIRNAHAAVCLTAGDPGAALGAVHAVLDGSAPVTGYITVVEAHLLAGLAHRALGDQRAANRATEFALTLAEPDRLVLPFAMTGSVELLEKLPAYDSAHAALRSEILDVLHGSSRPAGGLPGEPLTDELSPSELRVLRYLPTNLSRPEIARELSVSVNTVNTHIRNIYAKLQARGRSSAVQRARALRLLGDGRTAGVPVTRSW
ncbi:MAG: LuxR family transcriptional regulator, partial [Mycobacterium sp.]|nr:LuxR family transcriptional regulator [Mycobacterium sp.]